MAGDCRLLHFVLFTIQDRAQNDSSVVVCVRLVWCWYQLGACQYRWLWRYTAYFFYPDDGCVVWLFSPVPCVSYQATNKMHDYLFLAYDVAVILGLGWMASQLVFIWLSLAFNWIFPNTLSTWRLAAHRWRDGRERTSHSYELFYCFGNSPQEMAYCNNLCTYSDDERCNTQSDWVG